MTEVACAACARGHFALAGGSGACVPCAGAGGLAAPLAAVYVIALVGLVLVADRSAPGATERANQVGLPLASAGKVVFGAAGRNDATAGTGSVSRTVPIFSSPGQVTSWR